MKLALFTTLILLFSTSIFAQKGEYNYAYYISTLGYDETSIKGRKIDQDVKEILLTIEYKKKTKKFKRTYQNGLLTSNVNITDPENPIYIHEIAYNEDDQIIKRTYYRKGQLVSNLVLERNEIGKIESLTTTNHKNKIMAYNTWEYGVDSECLIESVSYKKGGQQANLVWKYSYYSPCQKSRSTLYNSKGKVIKEWSFDCKEEGGILEKKKNETQVCAWDETNGDYLLKVKQDFDEKGRIIKRVTKLSRTDSTVLAFMIYNGDDELTYEQTYHPELHKPLKSTSYRKGKVTWETINTYDGDKLISHVATSKGKVYSNEKTFYNEEGRVERKEVYDKKGEISRTISYSYVLTDQ